MSLPMLDPDLLRAFVAVVDHRSFTRAATALHRTQSAVSMQIKRLEERLGVELFIRNKATVEMSAAGEGLIGYARRLLALNLEAVERVREHRVEGVVRIGLMNDYGTFVVPPVLASFLKDFPGVRIDMETGLTATMLSRLGPDFDLVIAMHAAGEGSGELLRQEQAVWAGQPADILAGPTPLALALSTPACLFRRWALDALDAAHRQWQLVFVSESLSAVESVAAQGLAITVVKAGTFPTSLQPLSGKFGLPPLPVADIRLHRAANLPSAATLFADRLIAAIAPLRSALAPG